jgi:hypothetical protein
MPPIKHILYLTLNTIQLPKTIPSSNDTMHFSYVLALFPVAALAALNGRCTGSAATGTWGSHGICVSTSTCTSYGGEYKSGACPYDPDNVKCCVVGIAPNAENNPCGRFSMCQWTSSTCSGSWVTGNFLLVHNVEGVSILELILYTLYRSLSR